MNQHKMYRKWKPVLNAHLKNNDVDKLSRKRRYRCALVCELIENDIKNCKFPNCSDMTICNFIIPYIRRSFNFLCDICGENADKIVKGLHFGLSSIIDTYLFWNNTGYKSACEKMDIKVLELYPKLIV